MKITTETLTDYVSDCFHRSRIDTGLETTQTPPHVNFGGRRIDFCEDFANVYIVGTIVKTMQEGFSVDKTRRYNDDLVKSLEEHPTDTRMKFWLYKSTGDSLFIEGGLFDPDGEKKKQTGKAKSCYHCAAVYMKELRQGEFTPQSLTLMRLSNLFEQYIKILNHMGRNYFHITHHITDGEVFHLLKRCNEDEYSSKVELILDAYNKRNKMEEGTPERREIEGEIERLTKEAKELKDRSDLKKN